MRPLLAVLVLVFVCGCTSSSQPRAAASASPSPTVSPNPLPTPTESPTGDQGTPIAKQILPPAPDMPVAQLCSLTIQTTANGNAVPLFCKSGALNVQAWQFYATISAGVLSLGLNPTEGQVQGAFCEDFNRNHATKVEESSAYQLATAYYGWTFNLDPARATCP